MAVTLFHRDIIRIKNRVKIVNGKKEQPTQDLPPIQELPKKQPPQEVTARIRGKMYGRRTINR